MKKGSNFERSICKILSRWWTYGERDDVFWRSSQSGGRATMRARRGQRTAGSYGDVAALDSIGEPFIKLFTIELKRGRSCGDPGDLLDGKGKPECNPWLKTLHQTITAAQSAESYSWLLITKKDFRTASIFFPANLLREEGPFYSFQSALLRPPIFRYRISVADFIGISLDKFLETADPKTLAAFAERFKAKK